MIFKTEDNRTIVDFEGSILISNGMADIRNGACVILGEIPENLKHNPSQPGECYPEFAGKSSTSLINPIEMYFSNPASIDVLIEKLQEAKEWLSRENEKKKFKKAIISWRK